MNYEAITIYRILIAGLITLYGSIDALADPISHNEISVLDGDTIRVRGDLQVGRLRHAGNYFALGQRWTRRESRGAYREGTIGGLIRSGSLDLQSVPCSCSQAKFAKRLV